ncbi:MAG TPA: FAD-binding oxidoreductase [Elusimicrobiota bacterium]|jgi:FAD/FMN-containing dehydrogenase|nr:FAD-binding oxidoreductase [Elusimicrobiota bacterium]
MNLQKELAKLLGAAQVSVQPAKLKEYARDFAGHDLGVPAAAAKPKTTAQVQALVRWARARKVALTPVGARTSFWASSKAGGAVAVDLSAMSKLLAVDPVELTARAQAGAAIWALDDALRRKGFTVPMAPDGFGTATLASMVANDTSAGLGMFAGPASTQLVGLSAVLGTGEVLPMGASSVLGLPAFSRAGLPDLTGLLLASEGALGIVTEVTLRIAPLPRRQTLELALPTSLETYRTLVAAASRARAGAPFEGWMNHSSIAARGDRTHIFLAAATEEELAAKRRLALSLLRGAGLPEAVPLASDPPRWQAPPPGKEFWKGVSIQLPYARIADVYALWATKLRPRVAALAMPDGFLRTYFGREGTAALFGWSYRESAEPASAALAEELRRTLAPWGIPYRIGTVWQAAVKGRIDPAYLGVMKQMKKVFDPDGILNPGVGVFR